MEIKASHKIDMHSRHHMFTLGKPFMGENPNNLSYEEHFNIRTNTS